MADNAGAGAEAAKTYREGERVSVFNKKKQRWYDDGRVLEINPDGRYRVVYNSGRKKKWAAPDSLRPVPAPEWRPDVNPLDEDNSFDPYRDEGVPVSMKDSKHSPASSEGKSKSSLKFVKELNILKAMGFHDSGANMSCLEATNGDVDRAVAILVDSMAEPRAESMMVETKEKSSVERGGFQGNDAKVASKKESTNNSTRTANQESDAKVTRERKEETPNTAKEVVSLPRYVEKLYGTRKPLFCSPEEMVAWTCKALMLSLGFEEADASIGSRSDKRVGVTSSCYTLKEAFPLQTQIKMLTIGKTLVFHASLYRPVEALISSDSRTWEIERDTTGIPVVSNVEVAIDEVLPPAALAGLQGLMKANQNQRHIEGLTSFIAPEALKSVRRKLSGGIRDAVASRAPSFLYLHANSSRLAEMGQEELLKGTMSRVSLQDGLIVTDIDMLASLIHMTMFLEGFKVLEQAQGQKGTVGGTRLTKQARVLSVLVDAKWKRVNQASQRVECYRIKYRHVSGKTVESVATPLGGCLLVSLSKNPVSAGVSFTICVPVSDYVRSRNTCRLSSLLRKIRNGLVVPILREKEGFKLHNLPRHLLLNIGDFLDFKEICSLSVTCRSLESVTSSNLLWRALVSRKFRQNEIYRALSGADSASTIEWKNVFRKLIGQRNPPRVRRESYQQRYFIRPDPGRHFFPVPPSFGGLPDGEDWFYTPDFM